MILEPPGAPPRATMQYAPPAPAPKGSYRDGIGLARCVTCFHVHPCPVHGVDHMPKPKAKSAGPHRITTYKPGGDPSESREVAPAPVPIGEAMRLAVDALGDVVVDDTLAAGQLRELAAIYEDVTRRRTAWAQKADEAKTAKQSLDAATECLLDKVRAFTHPTPLPLFDARQAEAGLAAMQAAGTTTVAQA